MFLFTKIATQAIYPLNVSLLVVIIAAVLYQRRWMRLGGTLLAFAIAWLWLWSMPVFSDWMCGKIEQRYPLIPVEKIEPADAIVVLGGGVDPSSPPRIYPEVNAAGDRVLHAARLYKAGKAPWIIVTGGRGLRMPDAMGSEADALRTILCKDLGVPQSAILIEETSRNTRENALFTKRISDDRGFKKIILVTSAQHMPRALAQFRPTGLQVLPAPTDFEIEFNKPQTILGYLPDARALERSSRAFKELVGIAANRIGL